MSTIYGRIGFVILAGALSLATLASARGQSHSVLYSFGTGGDGAFPAASLTDHHGVLYGTAGGGAHGQGAVFQITTDGTEQVIYSFQNGTDGATPKSPVLNIGGTLYGTTQNGGGSSACTGGCGTVFAVTPAGNETVLYAFQGGDDGANPTAGLTNMGGVLYGTTAYGGANKAGTVYTITPDGTETVLYTFTGGADGGNPMGGLVAHKGVLYGTTYSGGANHAYGTVFSITPDGVEQVIYSFKNTDDGGNPSTGLVRVGKALYGTSNFGAAHLGTVFSVTPAGSFSVLHSFTGGADGNGPKGNLVNVGGTLYGVTYQGGGSGCFGGLGCGTVFSVTPGGGGTVVYSFQGSFDGFNPNAGLTNVGGTLYGTTANGGLNFNGTVFAINF